jgi:hypothetical protein
LQDSLHSGHHPLLFQFAGFLRKGSECGRCRTGSCVWDTQGLRELGGLAGSGGRLDFARRTDVVDIRIDFISSSTTYRRMLYQKLTSDRVPGDHAPKLMTPGGPNVAIYLLRSIYPIRFDGLGSTQHPAARDLLRKMSATDRGLF